ncbi:MAG: DUF1707 and DUF4870 domain-containing protein [Propionibacteriaceae bacterium]
MNSTSEHPSLKIPVTAEQRDRAEQWLQQAYAENRISEDEFEVRIGQVIEAHTRRELNQAFYGLVEVPALTPYVGAGATVAPTAQSGSNGVAALAHFSGLLTWIFGPGAVYLISPQGSVTRREAAKAFNFQLIAGIAIVVSVILAGVLPGDPNWIAGLAWIGWLVLTVVGGVKAAQGAGWRNPVKSVVKLDVLSEK